MQVSPSPFDEEHEGVMDSRQLHIVIFEVSAEHSIHYSNTRKQTDLLASNNAYLLLRRWRKPIIRDAIFVLKRSRDVFVNGLVLQLDVSWTYASDWLSKV